jgi:splicing factor 3B subunit 3
MTAEVVCMALANVPSGEQRSRFLAVGLADNTVRVISLDPNVSLYFVNFLMHFMMKT